MKVRGTEFDEVMIKLFIERFIERLGDNDVFYAKRIMEDIAFDDKDIMVENKGMMKVDELIAENEKIIKKNIELVDEVEYYVNKVIEYEHLLSKLRLDELIDDDSYDDGLGNEDEDGNVPLTAWEAGPTRETTIGVDQAIEVDLSDRVRTYGMINPITGRAVRTNHTMIRGLATGS